MDTIFMNSKNNKISELYRLLLDLLELQREVINMFFCQILVWTTHGKIFKKVIQNNKIKVSAPT